MQLVIRDANQGPFLTQVLRFGRDNELLSQQQLAAIKGKAVLMSPKFADKYYNKYKMHLLEQAAHDVIGVVSLGLQELSQRDPAKALALLQAPPSASCKDDNARQAGRWNRVKGKARHQKSW